MGYKVVIILCDIMVGNIYVRAKGPGWQKDSVNSRQISQKYIPTALNHLPDPLESPRSVHTIQRLVKKLERSASSDDELAQESFGKPVVVPLLCSNFLWYPSLVYFLTPHLIFCICSWHIIDNNFEIFFSDFELCMVMYHATVLLIDY